VEGTCLVTRLAKKKRKVVLGVPGGRITPHPPAGLHLVAKLDKLLGIKEAIDG
jgi:hypothetical protein